MGGGGSTYDYGFRIYNPQIGKFLSVDPLTMNFPWYSPYHFAGNRPIWAVDLDGREDEWYMDSWMDEFQSTGQWGKLEEYIVAVDNGVVDLVNLIPALYNSGVANVQAVNDGTWTKQMSSELKLIGKSVLTLTPEDLISPNAVRFYTSFFVGSKLPTVAKNVVTTSAEVGSKVLSETKTLMKVFNPKAMTVESWMTSAQKSTVRQNFARNHFTNAGVADVQAEMAKIDFSQPVASDGAGGLNFTQNVENSVNLGTRTGSAAYKSLSATDEQHFFSNIIDNYATYAQKFSIKGGDKIVRDLFQIEGSLNGKSGIFEWMVENGSDVSHRRFIPGGKVTGTPNQVVK